MKLFALFLFSVSLLFSNESDKVINEFLSNLKENQEKIKEIKADIIYRIEGAGERGIISKGRYEANLANGYVKFELTEPNYQLIEVKEGKCYFKGSRTGEAIEIKNGANPSYLIDIFQYNYFNSYNYKIEEELEGRYKLGGYKGERKEIEVIYDSKEGIVKEYYIIGNEVMPNIAIDIIYKEIGEKKIRFPKLLRSRLKANNITVTSLIEFENIIIKEK